MRVSDREYELVKLWDEQFNKQSRPKAEVKARIVLNSIEAPVTIASAVTIVQIDQAGYAFRNIW